MVLLVTRDSLNAFSMWLVNWQVFHKALSLLRPYSLHVLLLQNEVFPKLQAIEHLAQLKLRAGSVWGNCWGSANAALVHNSGVRGCHYERTGATSGFCQTDDWQADSRFWFLEYQCGQSASRANKIRQLEREITKCWMTPIAWISSTPQRLKGTIQKHCQRHNGPKGWVLITSSKQILIKFHLQKFDQASTSKS